MPQYFGSVTAQSTSKIVSDTQRDMAAACYSCMAQRFISWPARSLIASVALDRHTSVTISKIQKRAGSSRELLMVVEGDWE